jgi:hypothetical protein
LQRGCLPTWQERTSCCYRFGGTHINTEHESAIVDALDERAVDEYVNAVVAQAETIDISFNLIALGDVQVPLSEIPIRSGRRSSTTFFPLLC